MTSLVLLTGPTGAGKTSVLERLATLLERDGVEFGALESEQLGCGSPWLAPEVVRRQLAAVLEIQRAAGRLLFLIAATTETDGELNDLIAASGARRSLTVLLTAPADVLAARIDAREPDDWPGKQRLIDHARQLAETMLALAGVDVRVSTHGRSPTDVAQEVHAALIRLGVPG